MTLFPYEPSPQWTPSQVSLNKAKFEFNQLSILTDFEQNNYSQVTFQATDLEENQKLPVIKSDNLVIFNNYQSN